MFTIESLIENAISFFSRFFFTIAHGIFLPRKFVRSVINHELAEYIRPATFYALGILVTFLIWKELNQTFVSVEDIGKNYFNSLFNSTGKITLTELAIVCVPFSIAIAALFSLVPIILRFDQDNRRIFSNLWQYYFSVSLMLSIMLVLLLARFSITPNVRVAGFIFIVFFTIPALGLYRFYKIKSRDGIGFAAICFGSAGAIGVFTLFNNILLDTTKIVNDIRYDIVEATFKRNFDYYWDNRNIEYRIVGTDSAYSALELYYIIEMDILFVNNSNNSVFMPSSAEFAITPSFMDTLKTKDLSKMFYMYQRDSVHRLVEIRGNSLHHFNVRGYCTEKELRLLNRNHPKKYSFSIKCDIIDSQGTFQTVEQGSVYFHKLGNSDKLINWED